MLALAAVMWLTSPQAAGESGQRAPAQQANAAESPVLTPSQAIDAFRIAPGFRIEVVASEPLIEAPVFTRWDAAGRLWVVEMPGYMSQSRALTDDPARRGRVVVLHDDNGDGRMDRVTPFLENLRMPRSIAFVGDSVIVADPPYLWLCRDVDGDLRCDQMTILDDTFAQGEHVQHSANGLLRGIDNWLYCAADDRRRRVDIIDGRPTLITEPTIRRGQWGIAQDDAGRMYFNGNSSFLHVDLIPAHYQRHNPNHPSRAGVGIDIASDQRVYTARANPGVTRGDQRAMLNDDGRLARATAACSPTIYRGEQFPASFVGDAFVCEPAGNVVAHFDVSWTNGEPQALHHIYNDKQWQWREFIASTDERFRPVFADTGPDGCLYVVDMYRGVLEHEKYMTPYLREQIRRRSLDQPIEAGRIYRIVFESHRVPTPPSLAALPSPELVAALNHPNGWVRDTAQRLLVERRDTSVIAALRAMVGVVESDSFAAATEAPQPAASTVGRLHTLWSLDALHAVDDDVLVAALRDDDAALREAAIRISEQRFAAAPTDDAAAVASRMRIEIELRDLLIDDRPSVRRQLAASLAAVGGALDNTLDLLLASEPDDSVMRDAAMHGLAGRELEFLARWLSSDDPARRTDRRTGKLMHDLAAAIAREGHPQRITRLLQLADDQQGENVWRHDAILAAVPSSIADRARAAMSGSRAPRLSPTQLPTTAERRAYDMGRTLFATTCAVCHGHDGLGIEGKAPPLAESPFVLESTTTPARIIMHGLTGPIQVHGRRYDMQMPAVQGLTDEQITAIVTYIRRAWGHEASAPSVDDIAALRRQTADRVEPWSADELKHVDSRGLAEVEP